MKLLAVFLVCLLIPSAAMADFDSDYKYVEQVLKPLALKGDARAEYQLGKLYEVGGGVLTKDPSEAVIWFRKASDKNYAQATWELGRISEKPLEAESLYRKALKQGADPCKEGVDQGDVNFQLFLADSYRTGIHGFPKDRVKALAWERIAATNFVLRSWDGDFSQAAKTKSKEMIAAYEKNMSAQQIKAAGILYENYETYLKVYPRKE